MTSNIKVLADQVINRIAAGEVVERPASVVRELVDNSLDAGAGEIVIELGAGGNDLIQVTDNGSGIAAAEATLAFARHATSKIRSEIDLDSISTFGFRGEALASIAAVSRLRLRSRRLDEIEGVELTLLAGNLEHQELIQWPAGTQITVQNLFFNTPARRKFLKKPKTELGRVKQWLQDSSLANPAVHYRLISDSQELLNLPAREKVFDRAKELLYGTLFPVRSSPGDIIEVTGLIGRPDQARSDLSALVVIVNKRIVKDYLIIKALRDGFGSLLRSHEYPVGFIAINLKAALVDVNVHPQKTEVRFRDNSLVFSCVRRAITNALAQLTGPGDLGVLPESKIPRSDLDSSDKVINETSFVKAAALAENQHSIRPSSRLNTIPQQSLFRQASTDSDAETRIQPNEFLYADLRYLGQILGCYLVCEYKEQLVLVDMHAAHERINFNIIRNRYRDNKLNIQQLLLPVVVKLNSIEVAAMTELTEYLSAAGFEAECFGSSEIAIRGVPFKLTVRIPSRIICETRRLILS
jgi:DNA mismatch repair protein MutL